LFRYEALALSKRELAFDEDKVQTIVIVSQDEQVLACSILERAKDALREGLGEGGDFKKKNLEQVFLVGDPFYPLDLRRDGLRRDRQGRGRLDDTQIGSIAEFREEGDQAIDVSNRLDLFTPDFLVEHRSSVRSAQLGGEAGSTPDFDREYPFPRKKSRFHL